MEPPSIAGFPALTTPAISRIHAWHLPRLDGACKRGQFQACRRRIEAEHRVVEAGQPARVLRHHRWRERRGPIRGTVIRTSPDIGAHRLLRTAITHVAAARPPAPIVAQILGQLDIEPSRAPAWSAQ